MKKIFLLSTLCLLAIMSSCRDDNDNDIIGSNNSNVTEGSDQELSGFYLLNEGQMGANNSTLDYFDVKTGIYSSNIYAERNPNVIKELGDTGNDLKIYNGRLYAVMNGSHKVEIMTADSAKHIADVDVPNGRFICFDGNYAYVSSYVGASWDNGEVLGAVYKLDTQTATVVDSVLVGYQPEELAVVNGTLYVANSGGLHTGYDNTVSVIDLDHFTVTGEITVGINPFRVNKATISTYRPTFMSSTPKATMLSTRSTSEPANSASWVTRPTPTRRSGATPSLPTHTPTTPST